MVFKLNEYEFINVYTKKAININYFQDILRLIGRYKNRLLCDYMPNDPEGVIELIDSLYPWFFVVLKGGEFLGVIYCHNWHGNDKATHSCYLTAACDPKFYGKDTRKVLSLFCNYLFDACGIIKIKAEVMKENKLCIKLLEDVRFKKEGFLKCATLMNDKPQDLLIYGKINPCYLQNCNTEKVIDFSKG